MSSRAESKPIGDLSICVAIDKSGRTYGETLREEIGAVQKIYSLLSPRNENPKCRHRQATCCSSRTQSLWRLPHRSTPCGEPSQRDFEAGKGDLAAWSEGDFV